MQNAKTVAQLLQAFEGTYSIDQLNSNESLRTSYQFLQQRAAENPGEILNEKEAGHFLGLHKKTQTPVESGVC